MTFPSTGLQLTDVPRYILLRSQLGLGRVTQALSFPRTLKGFVCMGVLPAPCAHGDQERAADSPGTGVRDGCEHSSPL